MSGSLIGKPPDENLISKEKNSIESKIAVNFLSDNKPVEKSLAHQFLLFKNFNGGSQIVFMPSDQIKSYFISYLNFTYESSNLSKKEIEKLTDGNTKNGFLGRDEAEMNFSEIDKSGLVFFNPKGGVEMVFGVNSAFPLLNNPYFDAKLSQEHIFRLLMDDSISTELLLFCIDHCIPDLPFFSTLPGARYLNDIDFLLNIPAPTVQGGF